MWSCTNRLKCGHLHTYRIVFIYLQTKMWLSADNNLVVSSQAKMWPSAQNKKCVSLHTNQSVFYTKTFVTIGSIKCNEPGMYDHVFT